MKNWILIIFFYCSYAMPGFSQNAIVNTNDSLVFKKATDAFALASKNSDSAMLLANEALEEATRIKNQKAVANAYNSIGWAFMHKGHLDSSIINLQKSWGIFSTLKSDYDIIRVDINLSEVYTKQNQLSKAITHLMQADSISTKINNVPLLTDVKRQLAIVYRESGDQKKSAGYFRQALDGFTKQHDYYRYINTGVSLSILYRNMQLFDSSISILNYCLKIAREKSGTRYQVAMVEENLAETNFDIKNYNEALKHYSTAYNIFEKLNNKADLAFESFCMGKTLVKLNQFAEAEKYLLKAYAINDTLKMINYQADAANELAALYKVTGNWQKAFQYLETTVRLKDSLDLAEEITKTNELKEKFESEKKEQEIALLKARNQLTETDSRKTRLMQYIFILLFAASVIIGWLLYNRLKIKRKLEKQMLRNQIAGDLHDDIGSTLSSIDISSRIALVKKEDIKVVEEQLIKIRDHTRKTMDSMSDIVWSINPVNDNFESLLMRMREFAVELCEPGQITLHFNFPANIENESLDPYNRKNLFLIYKEAVNNAVKYSNCTSLSIEFEKTMNGNLLMKIKDDGKGFEEETVKKGNGLRNMKIRAEQLKGTLSIHSRNGKGTLIELSCPLA